MEVLSLGWDDWYVEIDKTVHSRQQVVAGVFDPALLRIGDDDYAAEKHHSLQKLQHNSLQRIQHLYIGFSHRF